MENTLIINGEKVVIEDEKNLLEVIRKTGVELPTFCYHSELSVYGACRMCLVEDEKGKIFAACHTPPKPGMNIKTHTERLIRQRRVTLELLLANHDRECTACAKSGNCRLQELAEQLGIKQIRFGKADKKHAIDDLSNSIVRDPNKCILCGDCVRMCEEIQGIGVIGFAYRGSGAMVTPAFNKNLSDVNCVNCGQCVTVCPTGALTVKSEKDGVWEALHNPDKLVVAQIAPAVRVSFGEEFGQKPGELSTGKVVGALKKMGFDMVFDTCFTADLTVLEESHEFLDRLKNNKTIPQFTSCCPAWVKFVEQNYPDLKGNLSSCRSPQQMFGSVIKNIYAKKINKKPEDIFVVSIMPCSAKKAEAKRPEFINDNTAEVDAVLTTREAARMVMEAGIVFDQVEEQPFDMPFGFATGGGLIFGSSGGVAEAVLRNISDITPDLKDENGLKTAQVEYDGRSVRLAIVSGLANARALIEDIKDGKADYDLVEVMACSGGCIGGGGQPYPNNNQLRASRKNGLMKADKMMQLKRSNENPVIKDIYQKYLKNPGSQIAHNLLHTSYRNRRRIEGEIDFYEKAKDAVPKVHVKICVGTCCYLAGSYNLFSGLSKEIEKLDLKDRVDISVTFCLENCSGSPSVLVEDKVIGSATVEKVMGMILSEIKEQGDVITK